MMMVLVAALLAAPPPENPPDEAWADAQAATRAKDWAAAETAWLALAERDARHERAPHALFNAAACAESAGRLSAARTHYLNLAARYPKAESVPNALYAALHISLGLEDLEAGLRIAVRLVDTFPRHERAGDALVNAMALSQALGRDEGLDRLLKHAARRLPMDPATALPLMFRAARWAEAGDKRAEPELRRLLKRYGADPLVSIRLRYELGRLTGQSKWFEAAIRQGSSEPDDGSRAVLMARWRARAALRLAEARVATLAELEPPSPDSQTGSVDTAALQKWLTHSLRELRQAETAATRVLEHKDADASLCAMVLISGLYTGFADAVLDLPVPAGLDEASRKVYREQLVQQMRPVRERAFQVLRTAWSAADQAAPTSTCHLDLVAAIEAQRAHGLALSIPPEPAHDVLTARALGVRALPTGEHAELIAQLRAEKGGAPFVEAQLRWIAHLLATDRAPLAVRLLERLWTHHDSAEAALILGVVRQRYRLGSAAPALEAGRAAASPEERAALEARLLTLRPLERPAEDAGEH